MADKNKNKNLRVDNDQLGENKTEKDYMEDCSFSKYKLPKTPSPKK